MKLILCAYFLIMNVVLLANPIIIHQSAPTKPTISVRLNDNQLKYLSNPLSEKKAKTTLALYILHNNQLASIPISGVYTLKNQILSFTPYFNLAEGQTFQAFYYTAKDTFSKTLRIPNSIVHKETSYVLDVFPKSNIIPSNILFFHVRFKHPMKKTVNAYQYVRILDENGNVIPKVWRERSYWLDSQKVLVLMVHPGRVKRGISAAIPFLEGKRYSIEVSPDLLDVYNRPIGQAYKKEYSISANDYQSPEIRYEGFILPNAHRKNAFCFSFSEDMDYGTIIDGVRIQKKSDKSLVEGVLEWNSNDSSYRFTPDKSWENIDYEVVFTSKVTDLASNHLHRLFEMKQIEERQKDKAIFWEFRPLE